MRADAPGVFRSAVELRIDGGMSKSAQFAQRLSDMTGVGVRRALYQETTALGAALFAGVGAGLFADLEAASDAHPKTEGFTPQIAAHAREEAYARWLDAVGRVRG